MKWFGILTLVFVLGACGRNDDNRNQNAQVPAYGANCVQNGGYGCTYGSYPAGWQAYLTQNGYYQGYNNCGPNQTCAYSYSSMPYQTTYPYFAGCPYGTVAAYSPNYGLGCVQVYAQQQSYTYNYNYNYYGNYFNGSAYSYYNYGGYNALYYCTVAATACGYGTVCRTAYSGSAWGFCGY